MIAGPAMREASGDTPRVEAAALARACYQLAAHLPRAEPEAFALVVRLRRAAAAVPARLADATATRNADERAHHVRATRRALVEVETQLVVAQARGWMRAVDAEAAFAASAVVRRRVRGMGR